MKRAARFALGLGFGTALVIGAFAMRGRLKRVARATAELAAPVQRPRVARPLDVAESIYDGKLSPGWADWGWGPHRLSTGPAQVVFAGFGGIILHHDDLSAPFGGVSFRYQAPRDWGDFLVVSLRGKRPSEDAFPNVEVQTRHVAQLEGGWREVLVDWQELNPQGAGFDGVMISSKSSVGSDWVLLDKVVLTKPSAVAVSNREDALQVQCAGASHPISPLIYGSASEVWDSGQTAQRLGGNPLSRFNWELGAWNTGSDWFFENVKQEHTLFEMVDARAKDKRVLALVVPMLGWVAKDGTSFGFPRALFGAQRKYDPYKPEAGDGFSEGEAGKPLEPRSPEQTSVPAPPELIESWVKRLVTDAERRGTKTVQIYILDNEPSLWNTTHRDVRPKPLSYEELRERSINYASAIRRADPSAVIAGPAEWGWLGYQFSAVDILAGQAVQPDREAHGGVPLVPWYLKQMAEQERTTGVRVLDMLDLHFYPAADKVFSDASDPSTAALRLRSTRALWDPDYKDESWIGEPVRLIPRMKEWVKAYYPSLKLSIGEWNFGAETDISGGLATAEALGRFGQQGLDAAFHWGSLKQGTPAYWAFRAFRNFDGAGGRFLDVSLPVRESRDVSLFASRDEHNHQLVLVLLNRSSATRVQAKIALAGCSQPTASRFFTYQSGQTLAAGPASLALGVVSVSLAPYSISVLELTLPEVGAAP